MRLYQVFNPRSQTISPDNISAVEIKDLVAFLRSGEDYYDQMGMERYEVEHLIWGVAETLAGRLP